MLFQDTWHKDQSAFDEDQLQNLSTMLVGTSYCECLIRIMYDRDDVHTSLRRMSAVARWIISLFPWYTDWNTTRLLVSSSKV